MNIRLGLCCQFRDAPIRFRVATAAVVLKLSPSDRRWRLADLCMANAQALCAALVYCAEHGIGAFRVNSQILPLATHPQAGYSVADLPGGDAIRRAFRSCGAFARRHGLRTSFHPDPFVVINSPHPGVVEASRCELSYQAEVAGWIGADVINLHGGGAYGDKAAALARLAAQIQKLPGPVRARLTLENDDRVFTPRDLLPVCRRTGVPLVYDVHHHRCLPDGVSEAATTRQAVATWDREPLFHLSSPRFGWRGPHPEWHHDYIQVSDFPAAWRKLRITVDVEAKAKERAVERLACYLAPS